MGCGHGLARDLRAPGPAAGWASAGSCRGFTAVIVHFYQHVRSNGAPPPTLDADMQICRWEPERDGLPFKGSRRPINYLWWALAKAGGFARPGFTELRIESGGRVVQRLIVTPRWYRFAFMGRDDFQIGDVWTSPEARRRRLASHAIAEAHRLIGGETSTIWYVADADNEASAALARACGYRLVATGRRTRRLGTRLLGQYVIDRFV